MPSQILVSLWKYYIIALLLENARVIGSEEWKEDMNEEEREIHRFALENGLWTPDPKVLLGTPEPKPGSLWGTNWYDRSGNLPQFVTRNNSRVSVQAGALASLPCTVKNVHATETVSWIRRRDSHLLTLGDQTYSADDRFSAKHDRKRQTWTLTLQHVTMRDAGIYECQVSSHPPKVIFTSLHVLQSVSEIAGSPDMYVEAGSNVTLVCLLRHFTRPPAYVFWYHRRSMINYDSKREISVSIQGGESRLSLTKVSNRHSGNYTCQPANALPSFITLHIIPGESPAAIQGAAPHSPSSHHKFTAFVLSVVVLMCHFTSL